ncbi:pyruvate formate-lyase activating enzyme [Klebsiella pneumoniae subsp. ozaenae]|uniref:Pyruvate formate-lyase activating enzyme n=1 Tax=Klebsiella pneumoniae subsp. ozaenae TaxID=574 RepID=A0A377ZYS7_KLEPO|nr:pyruvate formate-lyase activating enzyme [Klebsiella pneumoniae subsp. ozaenae]
MFATGSARVRKKASTPCLDTNGFVRRYDPVIDELLEVTDLVMLDLKQMNDEIHQNLVGVSNHRTLEFAQYLAKKNINVWIRYVVVPGWSDDDDSAHRLGEFTRDMGNVEKIELLPYHELGKHKWVAMGEEYKLDGVHPPKKETMERVKGILEQYGHKSNVLIPPGPVMRLCRPATAWEAVSAPPFHSHEKRLVSFVAVSLCDCSR